MADTIQLKFSSLSLQQSDITIGIITERINIRPELFKIPQTHGSIAAEAYIESLDLSFPFTVKGSSYANLRTNVDSLKAAFLSGIQKFTKDDDRYVKAQLNEFDCTFKSLSSFASGRASFIAHYPFWLSETLHKDERTPTSGVGYTLVNAGNVATRCRVSVMAPAAGITDNCQIENQTAGRTTRYRGNVAAADILEIDNRVDSDDFEVLNDGVADMANFEGDFVVLLPGNNTIVFTGTADSVITFEWRDCWY